MIWEPFVLALFLGLIVSAGLYFAYLWPSVEPLEAEPAAVASDSPAAEAAPPAEDSPAEAQPGPAVEAKAGEDKTDEASSTS